jgi:Dockerin type I domain
LNRQFSIPIFAAIILFGLIAPAFAPTGDQLCEQCGMTVDAMNQARFNIVDVDGTRHYACCPICTLKLVKTYGQLNITSFCDYNGPASPITIRITHYGSVVTLSPPSALIIIGGSCTKNRIVCDAVAADLLLAPPNNGTSQWLSPITNDTVLPNATRIGIVQAALQHGGGTPCPCEQCGMTVDATGQARFRILDAYGTTHIACCPVCTMKLVKTYGRFNITSYCDQYGPSHPIKMNIEKYGSQLQVTPSTAMIIIGGSCSKNRIVYNSSAADILLAPPNNGTSQWLSPLSNSTVEANATRMGIVQAALKFGGGWPDLNGDNTVDIFDAIGLSGAFNSNPGSPNWNPNADINGDSVVDIFDAITVSERFGEHYL